MLQMLVEAEADSDHITDRAELADDTKSHKRMSYLGGRRFVPIM